MEKVIGIYKITSPTHRIYIGQSKDIKRRFTYYRRFTCKFQKRLYYSFKKHGINNHIFEIIEECNIDFLNERERYWQEFYDVLNQEKGLNCFLVKTDIKKQEKSEDTKKLFAKAQKEKWNKNPKLREDARNRNIGLKKGEEFSKKMSIINKDKFKKKVINIETGQIFDSIKEASETVPHSYTMLSLMLNNKRVKNKTKLKFL